MTKIGVFFCFLTILKFLFVQNYLDFDQKLKIWRIKSKKYSDFSFKLEKLLV